MSHEVVSNINRARELYHQAVSAELNHGCVDISLQALGAPAHLVDMLDMNVTEYSHIEDILLRRGFIPNWVNYLPSDVTGLDIQNLLEGNDPSMTLNRPGRLAGFLVVIEKARRNKEAKPFNHVMAILPRHHLSRDRRRSLKSQNAYLVVDTNSPGVTLQVSVDGIAALAQEVIASGGSFAIAELHR